MIGLHIFLKKCLKNVGQDPCPEYVVGTVASNKFWSSMSFQNLVRL
jgi:hypothetical protein